MPQIKLLRLILSLFKSKNVPCETERKKSNTSSSLQLFYTFQSSWDWEEINQKLKMIVVFNELIYFAKIIASKHFRYMRFQLFFLFGFERCVCVFFLLGFIFRTLFITSDFLNILFVGSLICAFLFFVC